MQVELVDVEKVLLSNFYFTNFFGILVLMKLLELYAGSRSVGKAAEKLGWEVFSSDLIDFDGINYAVSILDFDVSKVPFKPDVIFSTLNPVSADGLLHTLKSYWVLDVLPMEVTVVAVVLQPF
jgi:hypothetical protein